MLADPTVKVSLEIGEAAVLRGGARFNVEPRRIRVRHADIRAVRKALPADDGEEKIFFAADGVDLVARAVGPALLIGAEAGRLRKLDAVRDAQPLRLAAVQIVLIALTVVVHLLQVLRGELIIAVTADLDICHTVLPSFCCSLSHYTALPRLFQFHCGEIEII